MNFKSVYSHLLVTSKSTKIMPILLFLIAFSIPLSTALTNILLTIFLLLWIIDGNFNAKIAYIYQDKSCFAPIVILVSLIFGCLYSIASWVEILYYLKKMIKLLYLPLLIYYFRKPKQRNLAIHALVMSGMLTTITGIIYYATNIFNEVNPFKNSIDTSLITTITTFLLLHKLNIKNKLLINLSIIICILINIFYLFYICSGRTSQLIFLLLIPVFWIQKINLQKSTLISILPILIIIIVIGFCGLFSKTLHSNWSDVVYQYKNYQLNPKNYEQTSISQRLSYYKNTFNLIKEKPLLGWGTGTFPVVYKNFVIKNNLFTNNQNKYLYTTNPHNEYLMFGSQLGIFGISLLLWFFYVLFKASFMIQNYEKYILQITVITASVGCLANSWIMDFTSGHLFIILMAICLGALPNVRVNHDYRTI